MVLEKRATKIQQSLNMTQVGKFNTVQVLTSLRTKEETKQIISTIIEGCVCLSFISEWLSEQLTLPGWPGRAFQALQELLQSRSAPSSTGIQRFFEAAGSLPWSWKKWCQPNNEKTLFQPVINLFIAHFAVQSKPVHIPLVHYLTCVLCGPCQRHHWRRYLQAWKEIFWILQPWLHLPSPVMDWNASQYVTDVGSRSRMLVWHANQWQKNQPVDGHQQTNTGGYTN